jgi:hypothetical protein
MTIHIPAPLKAEHDELHDDLKKATNLGGRAGEAAKAVAKVLHPHFIKEEEFALPPLGLLMDLARGAPVRERDAVLAMTDRLAAELPEMLGEHKAIVAALKALVDAANDEGKPEAARFAEKLILHAQAEEEVSYPTAILVGRYLKLVGAR